MSTETSMDVSLIKDEDVLRKMWQDTEDFGRKKEIRSHMYKLREARLRDFYNSGEVSSEIKRTTTTTTESKCSTPTHADSLADHSFISMKTKEIRDSESPTRDVSYRVTAPSNQGWTITSSNQKSEDGKTFTTSKLATTSGTEKIPGGKVEYAAKNEQQASVYQDGDDKNFTKAVGAASNTFIKQEASGGDANSSFKSSSTKTSSSSKYVSESRSTSGDVIECQPSKMITQNQNEEHLVSKKIYTDNIPNELKNHPGYVDGKTKVTRETRTLPDGSTVTTTRYEVKGGSSTQSAKSSHYSTTQQSSSTHQQSTSQATESRTSQNESKTIHVSGMEPSSTKTITRQIYDEELQPAATRIVNKTIKGQSVDDSKAIVIKSAEPSTTTVVRKVYDIVEPSTTTSKTTVIKNIDHINQESNIIKDAKVTAKSTVIKNVCDVNREYLDDSRSISIKEQPRQIDDTQTVTSTTKTTVTKQINDLKDVKQHTEDSSTKINEKFIRVEQQDTGIRMVPSPEKTVPRATSPEKQAPRATSPEKPTPRATSPEKPAPRATSPEKHSYEMPERRQPIKPGKSELDNKSKPTEGQYDTTYRTDYTNKKISVEVSPTHDAFARSLRSVSPDRITKCSTPRTSTHSLRSSTSPEKNRHPSRLSPERRSVSPRKTTSHETITYRTGTNTDTITRRNKSTEIDSSTLTRRKKKTRSRSPSPTSIASDIEFFRNTNIVTDLDTNETTIISSRPSSLDVTKKTTKKITDRSSTSPLTDTSKEVPRRSSLRNASPTKESSPVKNDRPFKRTDTYEERCRQILGITSETSKRKSSLEKSTTTRRTSASKISPDKIITNKEISSPTRRSPEKKFKELPSQTRKSPEKSPTKSPIKEFPSQIRKSPEKEPLGEYPEKKRPMKTAPQICEFPSQIRRSPEKEPLGEYPEKRKPTKEAPTISEFPSQIRRSPEKEPLGKYPEKTKPSKESPRINEFPSQIRKSPEKEPLGEYPEKKRPEKEAPQICEFPSQIRRTPEKQPWEKYPEKEKPSTEAPKISEFPSQIRRSPEKEPLGEYPEKQHPEKKAPSISEFPSQIRRSPEKEPLAKYPEKERPKQEAPTISELFPSQIRRSPEKEPLGEYPEKQHPEKKAPGISEFPSQIRRTPEKEPLAKYPEKERPKQEAPTISEFPSQTRQSPERKPNKEVTCEYPGKKETSEKESPKFTETPLIKVSPTKKHPKKASPKDKSRQRTESSSSSSTDEETNDTEETNIEEINTFTKISDLEGKIPVDEPLVTKRFIAQLGKDEENQRTDLTKKKTQTLLNKEIQKTEDVTTHKTVKKDLSRKSQNDFIEKERTETNITINKCTPRTTSPIKKPLTEKNNITITSKKISGTQKTVTNEQAKTKDVKRTSLYDIENMNNTREDNRIHIRTHRIDDTINRKVTKTTVNGDITRKSPTKRPQPSKPEEPKTKKIIEKKPSQKTISKTTTTITTEQKTPRRHIVSTTITVSPKTRPSAARSPTKSVTSKTTTVTKTSLTSKKGKLQNGHVSSEEESVVDSIEDFTEISTTVKKQKESTTRLSTKKPESKSPIKGGPKPEGLSSKVKQEKKCITTKSIIINNETTGREVVVDLQRSKSSREPTPDRICPLPVTSDDESTPRYPDQIAEPDDVAPRHKPKKLSDIPLIEGEDVTNFNRITEIEDVVSVDRVEKTDESLLSINKKIDKFLDSEKVTKTRGPAPKIARPKFEVDEDLKSDECLLSVSEKVNKFITTAEQLTAPQDFPQRPKSPKCQYYPEEDVSVSDKVAHFITTAEKVVTTQQTSPKVTRPNLDEVDERIKNDECLLSVSEKVSKFINTAEQLTTDSTKNVSLSKIDTKETSPNRRSKETTPTRKPSYQYSSIKTEPKDSKYPRRDTSPKLPDTTPKSTRRPSEEEPRSVLSPTGRLRSTESVRKAKALFENINKEQIPKQRDILSRPSVFEGRRLKSEASRKLEYETREEEEKSLKSTKLIMDKMRSRSKSPEKEQYVTRRSQTPDGDVPGYMRPLDRSLRPNSPHRESINQLNKKYINVIDDEESTDVRQTKFGVTLKRTDSGRAVTTTSHTAKSRVTVEGITEEEIEEIYELEILEQLLEKVTDYELRRKIRTQIRLVKKLISEGNLTEVTNKKIRIRGTSPEKITKEAKETIQKTTTEFKSYSYDERRSSKECTREIRRSKSPETKVTHSKSPPKKTSSSYEERRTSTEYTKETRRSQSPDTKPVTKIFNTQLKKTSPSSKPTIEDNRPEWAKQRHLKKPSESTTTTKTTKTITKTSRTSPVKDTNPITSSYGVGPTDDNGIPLFGLKALRTRNKTDTTKVQGTVIRSQYYSENGEEPVGEISVTKYSSDPRDLGRNEEKRKGITSITTTQKFGYKDTPSLKSLTSSKNKKEIEEEHESKTTKVSRRGSVKALSQKFIENAVETSKSERQSSYPKAGLILRTSSFKDSASSGESREGSAERTLTVKTSKTVSGETFLSSSSKITGVQDVISRMKSEEVREGDSMQDVEARGLLNKFIGSQVILSGLESNVKSTNSKRTTKITTTLTEGGKPTTKTRIFHHPISDEELESIWDEQTLRLLLEQSTDYEERRKIRARLRQVMAEQEACTELVEKASQDQIGTTFDGESQLLPLLQGLLEAPDTEQTADSGTESGEDQRNGLIAEVQNALDKLSASLRDDAADLTPDRRSSLLQLVTKLQAGLAASVPQERRSSVQGRFRRRQRPNRHTVGVSSEELADARRLIQEISLHDFTPTQSRVSLLQKQNSEGCVGQNSASSFKNFSPQKTMVKNAVAKPFSSSNSTVSGTSSSVQTPTEASECLDLLFNEETEKKPDFSYRSISMDDEKIRRSSSGDVSLKSVHQAVQQAAAIKVLTKSTENLLESEETDEDTTVKALSTKYDDKKELPQPDIIMQNNPIYNQQDKNNEDNNNFAYHQTKNTLTEDRINKFNTKKLKMRRANTIDIPKPLNFYEENDSDCSLPEEDYNQRRRSNYLALRGPIRLGNPSNKNTVPSFEPKTDNDKKFLAFINKHNENNSAKNSLWAKPEDNKGNIWSNKFGNIKTAFESASATPVQSQNTARQFWKSADDAVTSTPKYDGPKISKQSARNLREMFEEKQKQAQKVPWSGTQNDKNIVTGSLKVKAFEPSNDKTYKFVPQPLPVNKFSHAPQSAFKPLPKKIPPAIHIPKNVIKSEVKEKDLDSPLYLYSPKPPNEPSLKPWATSPGESRVLSLAASKFENIPQQEVAPVKPRKLSKDKVVLPFQQHAPEKLTAPYLVKTLEQKNNNTVKQLSGQYDNQSGRRNDAYSTFSTVKYTAPPQVEKTNYQHQVPPHYNVQNQYSSTSQQYYPQNQQYGYQVPQSHQYDYQNQQNRYMGASNQQYPHQNQYNQQYEPHRRPQQDDNERYRSTNTPTQHYLHQNHYNQDYEPQRPIYNNVTGKYPPNSQYLAQNYYHQQENSEKPRPQSSKPHYEQNQSQDYYNEPQYTSTYQYQPQIQTPSPQPQGQKEKPGNIEVKPPKLDSQVSVESLKEYNAVNVRVMTGPVCQQATTIRQKSPMNRDQHDIAAALNLKNSLQKAKNRAEVSPQKEERNKEEPHMVILPPSCNRQEPQSRVSSSSSSSTYGYREEPRHIISPSSDYNYQSKEESVTNNNVRAREEPKRIVSPNSFSYKPREAAPKPVSPHSFSYRSKEGVQTGYRKESLEINDNGESIVTSRFQIPVINVPQPESPRPPSQAQIMSKADSWNQICLQNQPPLHKPSPRASPNARTISKSKSSHTLALPKQFEAGMSKEEMALKRKTMEAFLGGGSKSPQPNDTTGKVVKRSINRVKTSEKVSTCRQSSGLSRSRTLPDICPELLDESNVDKAFEDLFKSSS